MSLEGCLHFSSEQECCVFKAWQTKETGQLPAPRRWGEAWHDTHMDPSNTWVLTSDTGAQGFLKTLLLVLC